MSFPQVHCWADASGIDSGQAGMTKMGRCFLTKQNITFTLSHVFKF